jgi:uncharacterized MAPEG superfamily protein
MPIQFDHSRLSFRVLRTYSNSVETLPAFGFALFVAIVAGVQPVWLNWLSVAYLLFRVVFWVFYYTGVGKVAGGPRTIAFVGGLLSNIAIAVLTILQLL